MMPHWAYNIKEWPLASGLSQTAGNTPITYTGASSRYLFDWSGMMVKAASGSAAFSGMRAVTNTISQLPTSWAKSPGVTVDDVGGGVYRINFNGTVGQGAYSNTSPERIGDKVRVSIEMMSESGSGVVGLNNSGGTYASQVGNLSCAVVSTGWTRFAHPVGPGAIINTNYSGIWVRYLSGGLTSVLVRFAQHEIVTGQTNQNPSEYVPTTTAAVTAWYPYENPMTVDANGVVTDSGVRTMIAPPSKGCVSEPVGTNKCTCYSWPGADQLGPELITNYSFDGTWTGNLPQGFVLVGTETAGRYLTADDAGDALTITNDGSASLGVQQYQGTQGKIYRHTVDVVSLTGTGIVRQGASGLTHNITTTGVQTFDLLQTVGGANAQLYLAAAGSIKVASWSMKEIGGTNLFTGAFQTGLGAGATATNVAGVWSQPFPGITISGGSPGDTVSIVVDTTAVAAYGYAARMPDGKVFKAISASTPIIASFDGAIGAVSDATSSIIARCETSVANAWYIGHYFSTVYSGVTNYQRGSYSLLGDSTHNSGRKAQFCCLGAKTCYFLMSQIEEYPFATSIMPTAGTTATRAATKCTLPIAQVTDAAGKLRPFSITWNPAGVTTTPVAIASSYKDSSNWFTVYGKDSSIYVEKRVAGTTTTATYTGTQIAGGSYYVKVNPRPDNTVGISVNGSAGVDDSSTTAPSLGTTFEIGSANSGSVVFGTLQNFRVGT